MNTADSVQALYIGYFGRAAEPDGNNYWNYQVDHEGLPLSQAAASFSVQHEATELYPFLAGTSTDASAFIDQVYQNLFNRPPDAEGKAYWMDQLAHAGPNDVGDFILDVISGAQGDDVTTLANKVEAATHFTNAVESSSIETTHFVDGHFELTPDALAAAHDVVDSIGDHVVETQAFIDAHTVTVEVPGGGGTVYVPVEPVHDTEFTLNGTLPDSSTENYDGVEMAFGSGNLPTNYSFLVDDTAGRLMGLKAHFRTGDDVPGEAGTGDVDVVWKMPAGDQDGTVGNENGANPERAHASVDVVLDFGVGTPRDGGVVLKVDTDPSELIDFQNLTLRTDGADNWAFVNEAGTPVLGMTLSNDGHVLSDSLNLGFESLNMPHGETSGDVLPGTFDVKLVDLVGTTEISSLHAQFDLA